MAKHKKRNGKIDFLKFLFSIIIVFNHSKNVVGSKNSIFLGGSFAVEFFFIVSGYLMMASIQRLNNPPTSLGIETKDFLIRKYKGFCPELIIAFIMSIAVFYFAQKQPLSKLIMTTFSEVLLINMSGIWAQTLNGPIWYLSSMLICMAILYPLVRKYKDTAVYIIIPLVSLLLLGWFCGNKTSPRDPLKWMGLTYKGNIRAFAELGIGIFLYPMVEKVKKIDFTVFARILLTVVEYALYVQLVYYMYKRTATRLDYFYLLVFAVALVISFSEKGIDAPVFRGQFFSLLGKYSLSLYLCHHFFAKNVKYFFPSYTKKQQLMLYYAISAAAALVVMLLSDLIRKYSSKLKLKRIFVRPQITQ